MGDRGEDHLPHGVRPGRGGLHRPLTPQRRRSSHAWVVSRSQVLVSSSGRRVCQASTASSSRSTSSLRSVTARLRPPTQNDRAGGTCGSPVSRRQLGLPHLRRKVISEGRTSLQVVHRVPGAGGGGRHHAPCLPADDWQTAGCGWQNQASDVGGEPAPVTPRRRSSFGPPSGYPPTGPESSIDFDGRIGSSEAMENVTSWMPAGSGGGCVADPVDAPQGHDEAMRSYRCGGDSVADVAERPVCQAALVGITVRDLLVGRHVSFLDGESDAGTVLTKHAVLWGALQVRGWVIEGRRRHGRSFDGIVRVLAGRFAGVQSAMSDTAAFDPHVWISAKPSGFREVPTASNGAALVVGRSGAWCRTLPRPRSGAIGRYVRDPRDRRVMHPVRAVRRSFSRRRPDPGRRHPSTALRHLQCRQFPEPRGAGRCRVHARPHRCLARRTVGRPVSAVCPTGGVSWR